MDKQSNGDIFINGKVQIIEMLQYMESSERHTLIKNIRLRNPQLADELLEKSITFDVIGNLNDQEIRTIISYVDSTIFGIALKNTNPDFQRKILGLAPRDYAEVAFQRLMTPIRNEKQDTKRAQEKVLGVILELKKKNRIQL